MRTAHHPSYPTERPTLFSLSSHATSARENVGENVEENMGERAGYSEGDSAGDNILARLECRIAAEPKRASAGGAAAAALACAGIVIAGLITTLVVLAREAGSGPRLQAAPMTRAVEGRPTATPTVVHAQRPERRATDASLSRDTFLDTKH